ncbi:MAG: PHP domain-containing protein [Acidobacteria bacterium]|nr:PHP domain-containing protein [Acidobacteriota bacterium]MCA1611591.1 PHP domain-containing protein [Acidobacteriota bacterium]
MERRQVARMLEEIAAMLELKGENPFKVRAYENGARAILGFQGDLSEAVRSGEIRRVKGIGPGLFANLDTLLKTGSLPYYDQLRAAFPPGLRECLRIPGFGARKAKQVHDALGIDSLAALEDACRDGRIAGVPGFGPKSVEKILKGIAIVRAGAGLHKYSRARARAEDVLLAMRGSARRIELAGGLRRRSEVVQSADFVADARDGRALAEAFSTVPGAAEPLPAENDLARVRLAEGLVITLRTAKSEEFAAALLDATGSAEHVDGLRARAEEKGLRLDPSGLFSAKRRIPCATEAEIYRALDLGYVEPELREGRGEIEAAAAGRLPELVTRKDLRGLIHVHTTESDGRDSLEDMLAAVRDAGYEWVAITDHSQTAGYAGGLTPDRVLLQRAAIRAIRPSFPDLTIFHGTEADILADGAIDFGDEFLEGFDVVVASVHSRFGLPREEQTRRLIRAVRNPRVTVLGHPTGRLLLSRSPIDVDVEAVLDAAAESGCAVEINCSPDRLDLDWRFCQGAVRRGILMAIDPDAHSVGEIGLVPYGINVARKGWVTAASTLNAKSAAEFGAWLAGRREG